MLKDSSNTEIDKISWSPWTAILVAVVVYFVAQIIASTVVGIYPLVRHWSHDQTLAWLSNSTFSQFWYVLLAEALTFGAIFAFLKKKKSSLRTIGWRRIRLLDIVFALAGFCVYFLIYAVVITIVSKGIPAVNVNQQQDTGFQNAIGSGQLVLTFISLVVLPPLVEEIVFRGFLFGSLKKGLPVIWAAVATSLIFASAHLQFGDGKPLLWVAAIDTFTLSLVLCYLRQKTDSLWPGILLHGIKNGVAFVTLFLLHVH